MEPTRPAAVAAWSRRHPFRATVLFGWYGCMAALILVPGHPLPWLFWTFLALTMLGIPMAVVAVLPALKAPPGTRFPLRRPR